MGKTANCLHIKCLKEATVCASLLNCKIKNTRQTCILEVYIHQVNSVYTGERIAQEILLGPVRAIAYNLRLPASHSHLSPEAEHNIMLAHLHMNMAVHERELAERQLLYMITRLGAGREFG